VREIANRAGVTAMLVNRYFGSKEQLFAEVVAENIATPSILTHEIIISATPGEDLATARVEQTKTSAIPLDGFLSTLHSASASAPRKQGPSRLKITVKR
jgi:AcrR family transcriptional regulator